MTEPAVIDATATAEGHPSNCTEVVSGEVQSTSPTGITVTVGGVSKELASIDTADIHFDSHSHSHNGEQGCHNNQSHDLDPDTGEPSITINGSATYLVEDNVTTDPGSGGAVNITDNPFESELNIT